MYTCVCVCVSMKIKWMWGFVTNMLSRDSFLKNMFVIYVARNISFYDIGKWNHLLIFVEMESENVFQWMKPPCFEQK